MLLMLLVIMGLRVPLASVALPTRPLLVAWAAALLLLHGGGALAILWGVIPESCIVWSIVRAPLLGRPPDVGGPVPIQLPTCR